jgi:hypothetical protein
MAEQSRVAERIAPQMQDNNRPAGTILPQVTLDRHTAESLQNLSADRISRSVQDDLALLSRYNLSR